MTKSTKTTTINCPHQIAGLILIVLGILFLFIGCRQLYEWSGQTPEQAQQTTTQDTQSLTAAAGIAAETFGHSISEGDSLTTAGTAAASIFAWKLAAILATSTGTILTGLLAKWLTTEKKINKAMIAGVEKAEDVTVKKTIKAEALAAGVESALHSRVKALT